MSQKLTNDELLQMFLERYPHDKLAFRPASESWCYNDNAISMGDLVKRLSHQMEANNTRISNMLAEASAMRREEARVSVEQFVQDLERLKEDDTALHKWMRLMEHPNTPPLAHEANVVAMKQWMWLVKRHTLRMAVVWQVAPIFWSVENGTGKSYNIARIIEPFAAFTRHLEVSELGEKFSGRLFAETLIAFLDEFAGVEKTNAAQLKAILTGKPIDRRSMHAETGFFAANRMSCIASSNLRPPHGFIDTSGMRRFWSIHCSPERMAEATERMEALDAIKPADLWRAVKCQSPAPQSRASEEVREYMETVRHVDLRTKTSVENFCDDRLEFAPNARMPLREFQYHYRQYCSQTLQVAIRGGYKETTRALEALGHRVKRPGNYYVLEDRVLIDDADEQSQ